jgi:CheY-like chemotaxis protein
VAKILVVSPDIDARELIVFALRYAGHQMKSVSSVKEGIEKARQFNPDLILLNGTLPGMNENEANRQLKSHEFTAGIPLVLFTSNTGTENGSDEKTDVGDELILNSISPDQLTDKVNSIVNRYRK